MPREQWTDESEAISKKIKRAFDDQIVKEYVLAFRDSHRHYDGRPLTEDVIWGRLIAALGIEGSTKWRYETGKLAKNAGPPSSIDGRHERYRPGLEEVFRYIAASDLSIETIGFPRGRVIVNRAAARALIGIRLKTTGQDCRITPTEVERLRFLERWVLEHRHTPGFTRETASDMRLENRDNLMGEIDLSEHFIRSLHDLYADWWESWLYLVTFVTYGWLCS